MPIVKCKICSASFYAKPFWLKRGYGKFCSTICQYEGRKNGKMIPCDICGKNTYKPKKQLKGSKSGKFFCSKSCQTKWRNKEFIGPRHANWKGGTSTYKNILVRSRTPQICKLCKKKDKRVLAVHHIDKNRNNNRVENLVWLCHNCHHLVHHYKEERDKFMVPVV
jgi:hypothetical protein